MYYRNTAALQYLPVQSTPYNTFNHSTTSVYPYINVPYAPMLRYIRCFDVSMLRSPFALLHTQERKTQDDERVKPPEKVHVGKRRPLVEPTLPYFILE